MVSEQTSETAADRGAETESQGTHLSSRALVGLLADETRRAVFAALVLGDDDPPTIANRIGASTKDTMSALDRLVAGGLVEPMGRGRFHLLAGAFQLAARREAPDGQPTAFGDESVDRRRILDQAFTDGRLRAMPAKHSRRLVVLDHISQRFEPGLRYSERQVNAMLVSVDGDTATLRRYLIDERFLDRADGEYWRIGGTFPTE